MSRSVRIAGTVVATGLAVALAMALALGWRITPAHAQSAGTSRIAYETSGHSEQVSVVNADGTATTRLGAGQLPLISPNGQMVAAANFGSRGRALYVYSTAGRSVRAYINLAITAATPLAWSPDSRYLAVQLTDTTAKSTARNPGAGGVAIVDTTTGSVKLVAPGFVFGASFEPTENAGDVLAYSLANQQTINNAPNIFTVNADGSGRTQITHDGRSLYPVWGSTGIAYDEERFRGSEKAPDYNIWLMPADGSAPVQITHVPAGPLVEGLMPVAISADGSRMVAEFVGQDTSIGYTVSVAAHTAQPISVPHHTSVNADGISRDGSTVLVTLDAFENPTAKGQIATIPFGGGQPTTVAKHAGFATWNG